MAKLARLPSFDGASDGEPERRAIPRLRTRYYAFLSYSHKDKGLADWLHRELEKFRVPHSLAGRLTANGVVPRRLAPIFRDQQDLSAGGDLAEEIKAALAASQFLIVLCSPTAATSRWTNQEIESFKRTRPEGCVLAAVVSGEPFASEIPGRETEECFPPALRFKYDRRGHQTTKRAEPLAADFREGGDGQRLAFLKLVAGMLGVGLDELVRREQTRRQRRLAWVAAASLGGMAVTSTLAVVAFQARNEAREQRREAEGLVAYMVGDLRAKLEPIGRLDALDGVGTRVLTYYKKQDASELSDAALLQRSRALNLMAEVAYLRGNLDEADGLYRQALAGTAEAVRRSPNDPKRIFDHAQNVFWLGEIARTRGQTDEAVADYSEYKRLADRLVAIEPDNLKWRMEGLYGVEDVGISLYNKRRFAEAARQFASALQPMENLAAVDPGNLTYRKELATVLAWLADAERSKGNLDQAIAIRQRQVSLLNQAVASGVSDVDFRSQLIPAHQGLGILLTWRGQSDRGVEELRAAVSQAESLIPVEPGNTLWKSLAAGARLELARTLLSLGKADEAAQETTSACSSIAGIRASDMIAARQTACLTMRARLALQAGADSDAIALSQQALASTQRVHSPDPLKDRYTAASIYRLIGDAHRATGDLQGASASWSQALATLPRGVPESPFELDEHALILQRLGRATEAQQIAGKLNAMGYRRLA
jgi:tetratricopeptide (TPR) repeat protein